MDSNEAVRPLGALAHNVLALVSELRKGTIERALAMSDVELGLHALLTDLQSGRR